MMAAASRPPVGRVALVLALALLIAGCGTPATTYGPATTAGGYGITETQIDEQSWEISFAGNRFTTRDQVANSVLYRAAEIADSAGAEGFLVLKEEVDREQRFSGPYYGPSYYPSYGFGYYGFHGYSHRYAHLIRPMRPYYGRPGEEFTVTLRVRLFSGSPPDGLGTPYNARDVLTNLRPTIAPPANQG